MRRAHVVERMPRRGANRVRGEPCPQEGAPLRVRPGEHAPWLREELLAGLIQGR